MKKIMLVGRSGAGKTTLTQAMKGRRITYHKTQYINNYDVIIDTPGEYAENKTLARALVLYSYEADVVGLLMSAIEDYSLYSPHIVSMATREVIGIVTQIDQPDARPDLAAMWLELTGCKKNILCQLRYRRRSGGYSGLSEGRGRCDAVGERGENR